MLEAFTARRTFYGATVSCYAQRARNDFAATVTLTYQGRIVGEQECRFSSPDAFEAWLRHETPVQGKGGTESRLESLAREASRRYSAHTEKGALS